MKNKFDYIHKLIIVATAVLGGFLIFQKIPLTINLISQRSSLIESIDSSKKHIEQLASLSPRQSNQTSYSEESLKELLLQLSDSIKLKSIKLKKVNSSINPFNKNPIAQILVEGKFTELLKYLLHFEQSLPKGSLIATDLYQDDNSSKLFLKIIVETNNHDN
tara:strand:+ start:3326 stop:3811 length:486 start_codon:yes stop_codon:yes gene_type:complete